MHDNAAGIVFSNLSPDEFANKIYEVLIDSRSNIPNGESAVSIGEKIYDVDFEIDADNVDAGFVSRMTFFDHYSGYGFAPVTVLIHGIEVDPENFKTMGKNSLSWKISGDGVDYVKFKISENDTLLKEIDEIDFGFTTDKIVCIDAICTFGINVYKGVAYPQCIVKDYSIASVGVKEPDDDDDWDLDLEI